VARDLGHEVVLYGAPSAASPFAHRRDIERADAAVFLFEFTTHLQHGDQLDWLRLVECIPRRRRVVLDLDGGYNDAITVGGDVNHPDAAAARRWIDVCDSLSDKIYQPTLHPLRPNVGTFFFHAYNPAWEQPLDFADKPFGMVYVGNNWFRWRGLLRVLRAIEPIRDRIGRIGLVGQGWDARRTSWGGPALSEDAYCTDPTYLRNAGVEIMDPVRFDQVVDWMGKGVFTPVIYRPLFDHLRLLTCRTFETPAANAIPLFVQDTDYTREIYGEAAVKLVLGDDDASAQIADVLRGPERYVEIVREIRAHLAAQHTYAARLRQLIDIVQS
jgi:glycosyltransferase involved in cell wall biosynthesis